MTVDDLLHALADYSPTRVLYYRWGYSWKEIIHHFKVKQKTYCERRQIDFDFLCSLASAALGGKPDKGAGVIGQDSGEGLEYMEPQQFADMKEMLGSDFNSIYGEWEELPI